MKGKKINIVAYYLSQYLWIMYIGIPIILSFIFQERTSKTKIHSSNSLFNVSKDPIIFAHLTDTHLNYVDSERVSIFRRSIRSLEKIRPDLIIFTGDIVDNYDFTTFPRYGDQHEEDWKIYQDEITELKGIPIVDIPGNHDMFGILSLFSDRHFLLKYSRTFTYGTVHDISDFHVNSFKIEPLNLTVVTFNPFDFPTAHPSLHYYMYVTREELDKLESILASSGTYNILVSHYPVGLLYSNTTSSSGRKYEDIVGSDPNLLAYLSGHTHPKNVEVVHHGAGGLEFIGPCNYVTSKYGAVSIDNGCIAWNQIDATKTPRGIVSYPIPVDQLSPKTIFNDFANAEIRVVMFENRSDLQIDFQIAGDANFNGRLHYDREIGSGKSLYTFPLKDCISSFGNFSISFSGDFVHQFNFTIGDYCVVGGEINPEYRYTNKLAFITYPIFLFALIIITWPLQWKVTFDEIEDWIETSNPNENYWYFVIFFGFFLVRNRFQKAPKYIRYIVFASVITSWIFPVLIIETEGVKGFIWSFGYVIGEKFMKTNWGVYFDYIYLAVVCFPMISICSSLALKEWSAKVAAGDIFWGLFGIGGTAFFMSTIVHEATGELYCYSLGYFIIPILFVALFVIWRIYEYNHQCVHSDDSSPPSDLKDLLH